MTVNLNITISDEAHELLQTLKKRKGFRNNAEAVEFAIMEVERK